MWNATADVIAASLDEDLASAHPALLVELAVAAMLTSFPLTAEAGSASALAVHPRVIRRAVEFIESHVAQPLTIAAVADAAGTSVRTLQAGFRRHLGISPIRFLRLARLRAARDELTAADPGLVTVADVARRWGFAHPSRFAADYRREFGEFPAETLRR